MYEKSYALKIITDSESVRVFRLYGRTSYNNTIKLWFIIYEETCKDIDQPRNATNKMSASTSEVLLDDKQTTQPYALIIITDTESESV